MIKATLKPLCLYSFCNPFTPFLQRGLRRRGFSFSAYFLKLLLFPSSNLFFSYFILVHLLTLALSFSCPFALSLGLAVRRINTLWQEMQASHTPQTHKHGHTQLCARHCENLVSAHTYAWLHRHPVVCGRVMECCLYVHNCTWYDTQSMDDEGGRGGGGWLPFISTEVTVSTVSFHFYCR